MQLLLRGKHSMRDLGRRCLPMYNKILRNLCYCFPKKQNVHDGWYLVQERSRIILKFADLVEKHQDELAALETWDNGKPYE